MIDMRFVGTWRLVETRLTDDQGRELDPYGSAPVGRVFYDASGNMAVQLSRTNRQPLADENPYEVAPATVVEAFADITTYFGTYTVDSAVVRIRHHIDAASHPNWGGRTLERGFRFEEDDSRLILIVDPYRIGRVVVDGELEWERIG